MSSSILLSARMRHPSPPAPLSPWALTIDETVRELSPIYISACRPTQVVQRRQQFGWNELLEALRSRFGKSCCNNSAN